MLVRVTRCINSFRIELPNGKREFITNQEGDWWTRKAAKEAKDMLCNLYGLKRAAIRFHHIN